ncbi:lysine biosynthesis protein LysW [Modestobacter sp. I12A-02628]|uniref:Zinc-ribbon domain-containing protein n=1 Tax=Goekera deserti TaxID=2497753 RepID=A0A7K3WG09_9ACTN|nr:zinc-ribbon domain-containing protein [Goekera deserti]MPQ99593.1 lysine biosynthesis protein LysW [Goekera deserti]NDI46397.1 lysine biosynthesis protein LysW [Goekera deserti]NEL54670.1 zinc-ribbon domain-containing protein [Goekera deserti]
MRVQECSTVGCTRQAAFTTRTKPAWCSECIDVILRTGGLEAVEPFPGPEKDRLTRCLTCGVQAHYRLTYTVERNRTRERTCRACFWKAWAADRRTEYWYEPRVYTREQVAQHLDANGWELLDTLAPVTEGHEPVLGKCRWCGKIQAARMSDFGWGCVCSRNTRSTHPTDKPAGKVRLADSGAEALDWWDHAANDERTLATVTVRATRAAHWRCPVCDLRFEKQIYLMAERPSCPACSARRSAEWSREYERLKTTPVADVPELLAAWTDDADPRGVMVAGGGQYRFRCPAGHHPRLAPLRFRNAGCPACRAAATRAQPKWLADVLPEIAAQWHPTRNGKYTPHNVPWDSQRKMWWRADCCGHEWQETVRARDKYQRLRCPRCRTILGALAWCDPGLAAEWSPANPVTAWHVRPYANTNFVPEWVCATNPDHVWQMSLPSRSAGAECPECRPTGKSRIELDHYAAANELLGDARSNALLREPAFTARKSWTVDVLVTTVSRRVVIEYDGAYWHRAEPKVLVDTSKSRDLLAAGYYVARLREDDLRALDIDHPRYREFRVYAAAPRPQEIIKLIRDWLRGQDGD